MLTINKPEKSLDGAKQRPHGDAGHILEMVD